MKLSPLCLLLGLLSAPVLADNLLNKAVSFGRELLDETRKLAPGIQNDQRNIPTGTQSQQLNDGRDSPAIEPGRAAPAVQLPPSNNVQAPPVSTGNNQGWQIVEEDHLNP
ncbi:hypothetical protein [Zobellella maritima]|uniref:hypothetical protein n=1 Tax=Zobellella maritima TaxID=2059725 RepID=UPI000E3050BA|nr:hypothetical protein [Zobellella maritima]